MRLQFRLTANRRVAPGERTRPWVARHGKQARHLWTCRETLECGRRKRHGIRKLGNRERSLLPNARLLHWRFRRRRCRCRNGRVARVGVGKSYIRSPEHRSCRAKFDLNQRSPDCGTNLAPMCQSWLYVHFKSRTRGFRTSRLAQRECQSSIKVP